MHCITVLAMCQADFGRGQGPRSKCPYHQSPITNQTNHKSQINSHKSSVTNQQSQINSQKSTDTNQQSPTTNHQSQITIQRQNRALGQGLEDLASISPFGRPQQHVPTRIP
jgi:hypothetical protein